MNAEPSVHLHIERLVIDASLLGMEARAKLQATVEAELTKLLTNGNLPPVPQAAVPNLTTNYRAKPGQAGKQIAQAVYSSLNSTEASR